MSGPPPKRLARLARDPGVYPNYNHPKIDPERERSHTHVSLTRPCFARITMLNHPRRSKPPLPKTPAAPQRSPEPQTARAETAGQPQAFPAHQTAAPDTILALQRTAGNLGARRWLAGTLQRTRNRPVRGQILAALGNLRADLASTLAEQKKLAVLRDCRGRVDALLAQLTDPDDGKFVDLVKLYWRVWDDLEAAAGQDLAEPQVKRKPIRQAAEATLAWIDKLIEGAGPDTDSFTYLRKLINIDAMGQMMAHIAHAQRLAAEQRGNLAQELQSGMKSHLAATEKEEQMEAAITAEVAQLITSGAIPADNRGAIIRAYMRNLNSEEEKNVNYYRGRDAAQIRAQILTINATL